MSSYEQTLYQLPENVNPYKGRTHYVNSVIKRFFLKDKKAKIVDLGCGYGVILHCLQEMGYQNLEGVDCSQHKVDFAHQQGLKNVKRGDVFHYLASLSDHSVDMLITYDLIEHLEEERLFFLLKEAKRVLVKGGRWIIHVPNGESPFCSRVRYGDFTHKRAFTTTSLQQVLQIAGFDHVAFYEDKPAGKGVNPFIRYIMWFFVRTCLRFYLMAESGQRNGIFSQNFLAVVESEK